MNILAKWSYGSYLAKDKGLPLLMCLEECLQVGERAFGSQIQMYQRNNLERDFDKGFYINVPLSIFSKGYSKNVTGFGLRTMTEWRPATGIKK